MKEYKCKYSETAQCPAYDGTKKGCPYNGVREECLHIFDRDSYIYLGDGNYLKDDFFNEE
jgi:hypothetical protein